MSQTEKVRARTLSGSELKDVHVNIEEVNDGESIASSSSNMLKKLRKNFRDLLVLEFPSVGEANFIDISRHDLFTRVKDIAQSKYRRQTKPKQTIDPEQRQTNTSQDADIQPRQEQKREEKPDKPSRLHRFRVKHRDLRRIDPVMHNSGEPSIIVREGVIIFSLEDLRAILLFDRCFVVLDDKMDVDRLLNVLIKNLEQPTEDAELEKNFEFRAIEAILMTVTSVLTSDLKDLIPTV